MHEQREEYLARIKAPRGDTGYHPSMSADKEQYATMMERIVKPIQALWLPHYHEFSRCIGGWRPREFSILCGATGVGKTQLLANWSSDLIDLGVNHIVASVETGQHDFMTRVLSVRAKENLNKGDAIGIEKAKQVHVKHGQALQKGHLILSPYENRIPVENLMADLLHAHEKHGCRVAMIDNLNFFMEVTSSENAIVEMDRVIHELIIFVKNVDMHVIMVMHPKKTVNGRVESEFDVKGSSTSIQESHNVLLYNRPNQDWIAAGRAEHGDRELKIAKCRRRGDFVHHSIIIGAENCVSYFEKCRINPYEKG